MNDLDDQPEDHAPGKRVKPRWTDFLAENPMRPPDWRWQRAGQLLELRARRRRLDDDWVARARSFRADLGKAGGDVHRRRLARAHPEILAAHRLRQGDPRRRWEVEARLLAGQADGEIADRVGVSLDAIGAYQAVFFDVRARLGHSDWILARAIGGRLYVGLEADDVEIIWKILAYHGGPHVLDDVIANFRPVGRPAPDPGLADQIELLVKLMATPVTPENALDFLRLDAQFREIDRSESSRSVAAVTKSIVIPPFDVHLGPETVPLVHAGCSLDGTGGVKSGVEGGLIGLSEAG